MLRILIAYDTTEGQTRTIAQHVVDAIARSGKEVEVIDIRRPPTGFTLDGFDAILIGASIHMSKHSRQLSEFVRRHIARLNAVPSGFFSVSLSAAGSERNGRTPAALSRNSSRKRAGIRRSSNVGRWAAVSRVRLPQAVDDEEDRQGGWQGHRHIEEPRVHGLERC